MRPLRVRYRLRALLDLDNIHRYIDKQVARIERSEIRDILAAWFDIDAILLKAGLISSLQRSRIADRAR